MNCSDGMHADQTPEQNESGNASGAIDHNGLTAEQLADLANPATQENYRRAYLLQIQRQSCPGCGDRGVPISPARRPIRPPPTNIAFRTTVCSFGTFGAIVVQPISRMILMASSKFDSAYTSATIPRLLPSTAAAPSTP